MAYGLHVMVKVVLYIPKVRVDYISHGGTMRSFAIGMLLLGLGLLVLGLISFHVIISVLGTGFAIPGAIMLFLEIIFPKHPASRITGRVK
jgi:hypothetical protein